MKRSIAVLAVLALSGCAISSREATMDLPGTSWVLVDLDGAAPVGETPPSVAFDEVGGVNGSTGCNNFSGEVTIDGNDMSFGALATTRMACLDDATAAQEQAFLAAMEAVTSYTIDDQGRLVLEGGAPLTFEVATEAE
jgi:heat shock protein HslJ